MLMSWLSIVIDGGMSGLVCAIGLSCWIEAGLAALLTGFIQSIFPPGSQHDQLVGFSRLFLNWNAHVIALDIFSNE
jgi:hypothetical protein